LIDFYDSAIKLLDKPWGLQISRMVMGGKYVVNPKPTTSAQKFWTTRYRLEGAVALQSLVAHTMTQKVFQKVKQPVFMGYYYKDKEHQDHTVSVKAMLQMFEQLGTKPSLKHQQAFPQAGNHLIACRTTSKDIAGVKEATFRFAEDVIGLKAVVDEE
jgi:hypothetical protein